METNTTDTFELSEEARAEIDRVVPRYPEIRSAALPVLYIVQGEKGYLSNEAIEWVAARLELEPINIYELVTFYPMLRREPTGKRHVKVCRTLSCALNGAYRVCDRFREAFDCELDEVSPDGAVTVEYVECIASCHTAPVVQIDEELYHNVDEDRTEEIIQMIRSETKSGN